jgi:hypothetical protein
MSNDLKPILVIKASEINALSAHATVAEADKGIAAHGEGDYVVVRIIHPVTVAPPPAQGLKVTVGEGFLKKPNARGPRGPRKPKAQPTLEVDDTDVGTA